MGKNDKSNLLSKINQIDEELKNLKKEKDEIQEGCKHQGKIHLAFSPDDRNSIRVYCSDCNKQLRYPTQNEIDEWVGRNKT